MLDDGVDRLDAERNHNEVHLERKLRHGPRAMRLKLQDNKLFHHGVSRGLPLASQLPESRRS